MLSLSEQRKVTVVSEKDDCHNIHILAHIKET